MAQLVARLTGSEKVRGSNPLSSTHQRSVSAEGADLLRFADCFWGPSPQAPTVRAPSDPGWFRRFGPAREWGLRRFAPGPVVSRPRVYPGAGAGPGCSLLGPGVGARAGVRLDVRRSLVEA